jgi:ABC-type multidrug transport system fused ATPase/permease subunit
MNSSMRVTVSKCLHLLSLQDRKKLALVVTVHILMGALDLVAVAIIGLLGALTVTGVQSAETGGRVSSVLEVLQLSTYTFQVQAAVLGSVALGLFVARTYFSIVMTRKTLRFLSQKSADISSAATHKLLHLPYDEINTQSQQALIYRVTIGVDTLVVLILGTLVSIVADASLLLIMSFGLFAVDATMALSTFVFFGTIGLLLYKLLHKKAALLGTSYSNLQVASNELLVEIFSSYKELIVKDRKNHYLSKFASTRNEVAQTTAEMAFLPNIGKYVIEGSVLIGGFIIASLQFLIHDASKAVAVLAIFLAAGTRIAPAVLRLQQGFVQIKGSIGQATPTLDLLDSLSLSGGQQQIGSSSSFTVHHPGFNPLVKVKGLSKQYVGGGPFAIQSFDLEIQPGEFVAVVGPSGSGKTTFVDCLMGITLPTEGEILISGLSPHEAFKKWPGAISYVPQDVFLKNGSIASNVTLGYEDVEIPMSLVLNALERAQLATFLSESLSGVFSEVGEQGARLSGGQKQRIGIARALLSSPKLLVLDEATSALDGITEIQIANEIQLLKGKISILAIAHRLSTIVNADRIYYLKEGKIVGVGTFSELRATVPEFNIQAELMGM